MKTKIFLGALAVAVLMPFGAKADNYFFSPNGAGDMDGSSWENAAAGTDLGTSLASGIVAGDSLFLTEGAYLPAIDMGYWSIPEGIVIKGSYPTTMTGTNTAINYPTTGETVFSADLDGDGKGDNGEISFMQIVNVNDTATDGDTKDNYQKVALWGITLSHAAYTGNTYGGAILLINNANVELNYMKLIDNSSDVKGGALVAKGSYLVCRDCIFRNNASAGSGSAFSIRQRGSGTSADVTDRSLVVFDRCEFTNNKVAVDGTYGGCGALADNGGTLYLINSTVSGSFCQRSGGAIRISTNCKFYCISSTFFNNTTNYEKNGAPAQGSGDAISGGTGSANYFANTIFVNETDEGNPYKSQLFLQAATTTAYSGGNNVWGMIYDMSENAGKWQLSTDRQYMADSLLYTKAVVFGTNGLADNGSYTGNIWSKTITPTLDVTGANISSLRDALEAWGADSLALTADLTKDQRGYTRVLTATMSGAMDSKGTAPVIGSGIFTQKAVAQEWESLGNAQYRLENAEIINVISANGILMSSVNGNTIDLSNYAKGVYMLVANGTAFKVIK